MVNACLCASVDQRASKHSALLSEAACCFYQKKQLPKRQHFKYVVPPLGQKSNSMHCRLLCEGTQDRRPSPNWMLSHTWSHHSCALLFPSPFLDTTQLCLSRAKQNKIPRSYEALSPYCNGNDNVLNMKSARWTKDKAHTFISVKKSIILVFLNHTFIFLLLVFFFFNKLPY